MYKIGFIDDDTTLINDYMTRLKRKDINLFFVEGCVKKMMFLNGYYKMR